MRTALPWLPLLLVAMLLGSSQLGIPLPGTTSPADAAPSVSGDVEIVGEVDKDVQIDGSGCPGGSLVIGAAGSIAPGDPMVQTAADCSVSFSSNNSALGASLTVQEDAAGGTGPAMKCTIGACAGSSLEDFTGANWAVTTGSHFGAQLMSAAGAATPTWATNPQTYAVAAASTACSTSSIAAGTCSFRFAAASDAADVPGAYEALVQFTAQAN